MLTLVARLFRRPHSSPLWIEPAALRRRLVSSRGGGNAALVPALVIDVRGPDEFDGALGHIAGARNIPLAELPAYASELAAAARPLVLVCLTDRRSSQAAAQLADAGIREVAVLRGGMKAWRDQPG